VLRLAALEPLRGRVFPQTEVLAITREGCLKSDFAHNPQRRLEFPFRLITKGVNGEKVRHFDAVIDATGVYTTPNWAGSGGAPCPGEISYHRSIDYHLPDVNGADWERFANKHTLVVGSGHSAASTLLAIADNLDTAPQTRLTWIVRRDVASTGEVYALNLEDPVSGRRLLGERANALVDDPRVDFRTRTSIESIDRKFGRFLVSLSDGTVVDCDNLVAHTGFRADPALWRELQVAEHPVTGGPASLSEAILETNRRVGVGLSTGYAEKQPEPHEGEGHTADIRVATPDLIRLTEPNFFVVGIKSYGRDAGFLLKNGYKQVRDVYRILSGDWELDLYGGRI
jgi:thioredoxin reductase